MTRRRTILAALTMGIVGCEKKATVRYRAGEQAKVGPLTYSVTGTRWLLQAGEGIEARIPKERFYLIALRVTNNGPEEFFMPGLQLEDKAGKVTEETSDGSGIAKWVGPLRRLGRGENLDGVVVFDLPVGSYSLRIVGEDGETAAAYIDLPFELVGD